MEENQSLFSLTIDPGTKAYLNETARWARFLSIFSMIVMIIVFLFMVLTATVLDNTTLVTVSGTSAKVSEGMANSIRIGLVIGSLVMMGIAFIPLFYLLRFANKMRQALAMNQQSTLNSAFHNLKRYFRFLGILVIVILVLYACAFAIGIFTGNNSVRY